LAEYVAGFRELLERERRAEMEAARQEIRALSARERERLGRAVTELRGRGAGMKYDLWLVRLGRDRPVRTEIGAGDVVLVSRGDPLRSDLTATVMRVGSRYLELAFATRPPAWVRRDGVRVDLYVNDITFKRMQANLDALPDLEGERARLRDVALGMRPSAGLGPVGEGAEIPGLNAVQSRAVREAEAARDLYLIHGPPGTGKTTTLTALILREAARGRKILAAADSNVAVDNLLLRLADSSSLRLLRVGHPARVGQGLERYTLAEALESHPVQEELRRLQGELAPLLEERDRHLKPTPGRLRGMSRSRVCTLAEEGRGMRGVSPEDLRSMARWIALDEAVQELYDRMRSLEAEATGEILDAADVVCCTNAMVGSEALEGRSFDLAVIDEGSQQMEPSTLLPLLRAPRAVLAGDHRQLPPTVLSGERRLLRSLFEGLMEREDLPARMLEIQYRMHERIMEFPNRLMYEGKLRAHPEAARRTVLPGSLRSHPVLSPELPVVFAELEGAERKERRSHSYENPAEAEAVAEWVGELTAAGVPPRQIGVITPYAAQVRRIARLLEASGIEGVEVKSVDGFQGREKEVILLSFVRCNREGELGFVADRRRLNVAMTRARSKLILTGCPRTLAHDGALRELLEWAASQGALQWAGQPFR
jgi:predicted DNA helicase